MLKQYLTMKKLFLLFLVLSFNSIVLSQTTSPNWGSFQFNTTDRIVSWVKVYELDSGTKLKDLKSYLIDNNLVEIQMQDSLSLNGVFVKRSVDIQKYGYKRSTTPIGILDTEQTCKVKIEYKEGRYRVTLTDIGQIDNGMSDIFMKGMFGLGAPTSKGNFVTYNGEYSFTKTNEVRKNFSIFYEILDKFYSDIFTYKKPTEKVDNW